MQMHTMLEESSFNQSSGIIVLGFKRRRNGRKTVASVAGLHFDGEILIEEMTYSWTDGGGRLRTDPPITPGSADGAIGVYTRLTSIAPVLGVAMPQVLPHSVSRIIPKMNPSKFAEIARTVAVTNCALLARLSSQDAQRFCEGACPHSPELIWTTFDRQMANEIRSALSVRL